MGIRFFIAAVAGQRVVDVSQSHDLSGDRDIVPYQSVGIASPIIALVVPAADLIGGFDEQFTLIGGEVFQHFPAHHGVGLHDLKLLCGQAAGLIEDLLVHSDLTDIMESRGHADEVDIRLRKRIAVSFAL